MNINKVQYSYNNKFNIPAFKSKYRNAGTLHDIQNLSCACCGREMINFSSVANVFATISKPLSQLISSNLLDKWKEIPGLWQILMNLAERHPENSFDSVLQINDDYYSAVRRAIICDFKAQNPDEERHACEQIFKIVYKLLLFDTRQELEPASVVMEKFKDFKPYLQDGPLRAFEHLELYAQKYPDKHLSEIIAIDEIYEHHKIQNELTVERFHKKLDEHFNNILNLVKREDPLAITHFEKVEQEARKIILSEKDIEARMFRIKNRYARAIEVMQSIGLKDAISSGLKQMPMEYERELMQCQSLKDAIFNELEQMPMEYAREDAFFVAAYDGKWSDAQIIRSILRPFSVTSKHIIPNSQGGVDNIYNRTMLCRRCDNAGLGRNYNTLLKYHPQIPIYTQKQINQIIDGILNRTLPAEEVLVRWPVIFSNNVMLYTGGAVSPITGDYSQKAIELTKQKIAEKEERIKALESEKEILSKRITEMEENIRSLHNDIDCNISQIMQAKKSEEKRCEIKSLVQKNTKLVAERKRLREQIEEANTAIQEKDAEIELNHTWIAKNNNDIAFFESSRKKEAQNIEYNFIPLENHEELPDDL